MRDLSSIERVIEAADKQIALRMVMYDLTTGDNEERVEQAMEMINDIYNDTVELIRLLEEKETGKELKLM